MRLRDWLDSGDLQQQPPTRDEIGRLLEIADRDVEDAAVSGISVDRQFAIAYEAALTLALIVLRASGYRTPGSSSGHHWLTFALLPELMGEQAEGRSRYFHLCRRKRHQATYDRAGVATESELEELTGEVKAFRRELMCWLTETHSALVPDEGKPRR